ncbi:MAG TPA: ComEC/Rec2 family competence protein [Candidatus Paceibacterota bacterium]|nr:ComEC/Rec2 family competence protein [Candidatus Paceibacterota bacterium]
MERDSLGAFLYILTSGLILGVAIALVFPLKLVYFGVLFLFILALLAFGALYRQKYLLLGAILCAALMLGFIRADFFLFKESQETIATFASTSMVTVVGTIVNDPAVSGTHLQANVSVTSVNGNAASGVVLAFLPPQTSLVYGQQVAIGGVLEAPTSFVGDNGNTFDYPTYLRAQGVSMLLNRANLNSVQPAPFSIHGFLFSIKHYFDASIERVLPEPDASLLEGILLGQRKGLPAALTAAFVIAGLIHIVILSGYSMSVVSQGILTALQFLPRRWQMLLAGICMIAFVVMTGAAATTVRACAMAIIALVARYGHRSALAMRSLFVVAAAMVLYNPVLILGDASFFTSVLATFGLIVFSPSIEQLLWRVPQKYEMRSIITSTIAVQIFALPALLYFTGTVSFLSVPANLLVLPLLPFIMIFGLLTGVVGFISSALAFVPAVVTDLLLKWILLVVHVVQLIPYSSATLTQFPLWFAIALYIPLTMLAIFLYRKDLKN